MKKNIVVLGSSGSIGESTFRVLQNLREDFAVTALVAEKNYRRLAAQAIELGAKKAVIADDHYYDDLSRLLPDSIECASGKNAIMELMEDPSVDIVLCAIVGTGGLLPVLKALEHGKQVALASKEVLVMAGELVMEAARKHGGSLIPVDSEHSAIFQCLAARKHNEVQNLIITASGGAFRNWPKEKIMTARLEDALKHPVWSMGRKITIDSASLMNKALEVVEASFLFHLPCDRIQVLLHPESIVHSMVEFCDNSVLALMSQPSMELPIQYALTYPERKKSQVKPLNLAKIGSLHFGEVDQDIFPSIIFARAALRAGGTLPAVMNGANEVAVEKFCRGEIAFHQIWSIIEKTMQRCTVLPQEKIETILMADAEARQLAAELK